MKDEDFENIVPVDPLPLLQEGVYPMRYRGRRTTRYSYGEKLVFDYEVGLVPDFRDSKTLSRYYNVKRNAAGRFKFGPLHDYRRDWIAANYGKWPAHPGRLPLSVFQSKVLLGEIETVKTHSRGRPLHPSNYYSRVGRVIRPLEDGESFETLPVEPLKFPVLNQ